MKIKISLIFHLSLPFPWQNCAGRVEIMIFYQAFSPFVADPASVERIVTFSTKRLSFDITISERH